MRDVLTALLETLKYGVYLQGSLAPNEPYPDSFFTIWNTSSDDGNHYDDDAAGWWWSFQINFYSVDPALVTTVLLEVRSLLRQNGWTVNGKGYDLPVDQPTHTGRGIDASFYEINK